MTTFPSGDRLVWNEGILANLLRGSTGAVCRDLGRRAIRVQNVAKQNFITTPRTAPGPPGPHIDTGRLRSSISWRLGADGIGAFADVGSNVVYAAHVEDLYPFLKPSLRAGLL